MPESILFVSDSNTNIGFQLAGVRTLSVDNFNNIENQLEEFVTESNIGLIVVDDYLYSNFSESFKKKLELSKRPIIISIPLKNSLSNKQKSQLTKNYVKDLIAQSSGIHIRLD